MIQMLNPMMPNIHITVRMPAPARSVDVMGLLIDDGTWGAFVPAFGSLLDVPPVSLLSGAIAGVINCAEMTLSALI
jgi:hypothetical protein